MEGSNRFAVVEVSFQAIHDLLRLPDDIEIKGFFEDYITFHRECVFLKLRGDGLPAEFAREEGERIKQACLTYDQSGDIELISAVED